MVPGWPAVLGPGAIAVGGLALRSRATARVERRVRPSWSP
ncbi:hypothetical protein KIPE111705_02035 [Kibdelosporangium persicum]